MKSQEIKITTQVSWQLGLCIWNNFCQLDIVSGDLEGRSEARNTLCHYTHLINNVVETERWKGSCGRQTWHSEVWSSISYLLRQSWGSRSDCGHRNFLILEQYILRFVFKCSNSSCALFLTPFKDFSLHSKSICFCVNVLDLQY